MRKPKSAIIIFSTLLCLICIFTIFSNGKNASANSNFYGRIITDDTIFYKDEFCSSPLFFLPYTYYVKILGETTISYHVQCGGGTTLPIDGYVKKDSLFFDSLPVITPYPNFYLTTLCTAVLYQNPDSTLPIQYVFANRNLQFYGSYINLAQKRVYCVAYNGNLGFIAEETVQPFSLPFHPNELTFILPDIPADAPEEQPETSSPPTSESSDLIIKITVIGCLVFAGIISLVIAITSKKKPKSTTPSFYDENDYE